ncbi:MAG: phosphate/phosphite/phosphonate ABC transporter substrate-binding protein [Propionibacteriaceae bacterium]|jgi:phosphonate transport system substrate-binding protein|nr:phosphate/phosphite/phosphonate ABC transporter substrate-binding protein [Propionibacteriaceae bacterium]
MKKPLPICLSLLFAGLLLAGCAENSAPPDGINTSDTKAGWPEKITIVQMPDEGNPDAGTSNDAFRTAMEAALGIEVEELEAFEYAVGIEAMRAGNLELLLVSPMSYYQAKTLAQIEPLVTTATNGALPYKTVFVTRAERDDINSLADLRGTTFAFVDPASSSGYMYPKAELITELGLDSAQLEKPGYFFETVTYSGKHDSSLIGVYMGDYDAVSVAYQTIDQLHEAGIINKDELKIIGETEIIPSACYIMRADLPQDLKDAIRKFYLGYNDTAYFEMFYGDPNIRYVEAFDSDYDVVYEMVQLLGIEES